MAEFNLAFAGYAFLASIGICIYFWAVIRFAGYVNRKTGWDEYPVALAIALITLATILAGFKP